MKTAFAPIVNEYATILILGTMPGERSLALQQYYGHAANHFWKIMFVLLGQPFSKDYLVRKQLLLDNHIALWDVLQFCEGKGSSDNNIRNEIPNNFAGFYAAYPQINKVFFASQAAEKYYLKYVGNLAGLVKEYHTLPSPSSANTWKTFAQKLDEWQIVLNN